MPEWAAVTVSAVVIATGGYVVRTLVRISNTLGSIDSSIKANASRIDRLERHEDARESWVERGHL